MYQNQTQSSPKRSSYVSAIIVAIAAWLAIGSLAAIPAAASVSVTGTSVTSAPESQTTALTGMGISGYDPATTVLVTVSTTLGSLTMPSHSGLTLSFGYSSFSGATFAFTGTSANINTGLSGIELVTGGTPGTADVSITVLQNQSGIGYLPATGHFYEFVASSNIPWTSAQTAATGLTFAGQPGYLASITNSTVNTYIANNVQNATNVWFGGEATDYPSGFGGNTGIQRVWRWVGGPSAGQAFTECTLVANSCVHTNDTGDYYSWATGEPNNSGGTESYGVTNWSGTLGSWNDLSDGSAGANGYVAEFGGGVNINDGTSGFTGVFSADTNVLVGTTANSPTAAAATAGNASAVVTWSAPGSNGGSTITGYTVTSLPDGKTCVWSSGPLTCTVSGLTNGTSYTFSVTATNGFGTGGASSPSNAVIPATLPSAPTNVEAVEGVNNATVTWSAPANNGSAITGYTVTAAPGGQTCLWSSGPLTCVVTGLTNGLTYTFSVVATNGVGPGPASSVSNTSIPATPALTLDLVLAAGEDPSGHSVAVSGAGLEPNSTVDIVLHSNPVTLATPIVGTSGSFSTTFVLPTGITPGQHTIIAAGIAADSSTVSTSVDITVPAVVVPNTGAGGTPDGGVPLILLGFALLAGARQPRRESLLR